MIIENIINKNIERKNQAFREIEKIKDNARLIQETVDYLSSEEAIKSIESDPYWSKWATPWWRITLLYEMGFLNLVPEKTIAKMEEKINSHYIKFFPFVEAEIPDGIDPIRQIPCHCQLGTAYKIFYEINKSKNLQWVREWFIKYQINDGGLNCDESVYTKDNPKSSIVSTLPCLEAILKIEELSEEEINFLDKGAEYLINKNLFRKSNGEIINQNWLKPFFPRFYEYDILRGLTFIVNWAIKRNKILPVKAIEETIKILNSRINENGLMLSGDLYFLNEKSRFKTDLFPLLESFSNQHESKYLSFEWYKVIYNLKILSEKSYFK